MCAMPIQCSARNARYFKFNDLHIFTSLSSVMVNMSRDSIVDRQFLRQRYLPYAVNSRPTLQKIWGGFFHGVYRSEE